MKNVVFDCPEFKRSRGLLSLPCARSPRKKTFQCVSHLLPCTNFDEGTGSMEQMDNEDAGDMENIDKMDSTQLKEKVKLSSDRGDSHKNLRSCKIQA